MDAPLHELTLAEIGRRLRRRSLSSVEITRAYLDRIDALNGTLAAYIAVTAERALDEAAEADADFARGRDRGPMQGVPYALKDIYATRGLRTTGHSRLLADNLPAADCTVQAKLRAAGGVLLGKQATWEFTYGGPSFDLPWPPARNPWDLSTSPLGSSSGSAVAIAAGLCPGAMGSDTGGSIRMPATACGVAGLKPTYGLISRSGVLPNAYSFDHCGPMAWTSEDCALLLATVAGHDRADPASLDVPIPDYATMLAQPLEGLRIGLIRHWYEEEVRASDDVVAAMDRAVAVLRDLGCTVQDVVLPSMRDFTDCKTPISLAEIYTIHEKDLKTRPRDFGHSLRWRIMPGALVRAEDYIQAMRWRAELTAETLAAFDEVDLLVTAGSFAAAPKLAPDEPPTFIGAAVPSLTTPFNLTGMPALSVCNGFEPGGLPLGMQIAARPLDDGRVLALGHAFERATSFRQRRPEFDRTAAASPAAAE